MGNHEEAYDAELFAIMKGIHHLASRHCNRRGFTILTDLQAAISRIQPDAPRPGQDMAQK